MILRGTLFRKYVVYFVTLVTVALVASGAIGVYFTYKESKTALLDLQREKAAAAASRIEAYVSEIEHQTGWMRLPQAGAANPEQRRFDYLKLLRQVPAVTDVTQLDRSGNVKLRVSRLGMDVAGGSEDLSKDPKFTVPKSGKTYFSPVYFRKETEPYMTISMAGISEEAGITVAEVNLKFIWDVISRIKIGDKGFAYVIDSQGHLIAHPGLLDQMVESAKRGGRHAEPVERETSGLFVEQTHHHAFTMTRRQRRDAHVHRPAGDAQHDAAILRQTFFGDVELGHDFYARHHRRVQGTFRLDHVAQCAIDTESYQ